ncbi:MAG: type II toxin-antitoxin system RelE/ParE family toxin, partial [Fimbriimonadales bacterium]
MARRPRKLVVSYAARASAALAEIWDWNAARYGAQHADRYVSFLRSQADNLATEYHLGKSVP